MLAPLRPWTVLLLSACSAGMLVHCSSSSSTDTTPTDGGASSGTSGSSGSSSGASGSSGGGGDAADDAPRPPRCDPSKPFGTPQMLLENSFVIDQSARLSPDELTLTYMSYGQPGFNGTPHLWVAKRTSTAVAFKNPVRIDELATADGESEPTLTADGLTMYYIGSVGDAGYGVVKVTRPSTSAPWSGKALVGVAGFAQIYVTPDGTRLYGMHNDQIYAVSLPYGGAPPDPVVSGTPRMYWPVVSADGLTIFFAWPTITPYQWELLYATRATASDAFGLMDKPVMELNTSADEHPTWISPDGCALYFQRVNASIPDNPSGMMWAMRGF